MTVWVVVAEMKTEAAPLVWIEGVGRTKRAAEVISDFAEQLHGDKVRLSISSHEVQSA